MLRPLPRLRVTQAIRCQRALVADGGAPGSWQPLQVGLRLAQAGTVALSVEADGALGPDVYFDNVRVEQSGGLIVQEQHQYAYGAPLPGLSYTVGNKRYRYGYQGQFAEHDDETGFESFELRLYNSRIGRWLSYDPEGQYSSPYVGMGNNPVSGVDPNGGWSGPGLDGAAFGAALGNVSIKGSRGLSAWARIGLQAASSVARRVSNGLPNVYSRPPGGNDPFVRDISKRTADIISYNKNVNPDFMPGGIYYPGDGIEPDYTIETILIAEFAAARVMRAERLVVKKH